MPAHQSDEQMWSEQRASLRNAIAEFRTLFGQSEVIDAHGRIAGFFTWENSHPMTLAMNWLMPLIGGFVIAPVGFAGFSLWQLRRARHELTASEKQAAPA